MEGGSLKTTRNSTTPQQEKARQEKAQQGTTRQVLLAMVKSE
jgi:hypothetical protein